MYNNFEQVNGFKVYGFDSRKKLIDLIKINPKILIAINAEKIYAGNKELQQISQIGIGYPDGIGAVMALRKKGITNVIRIPGSELWLDIIADLDQNDSIYLIGSTQEVIEATVQKLKKEYPNLSIAGYRNGFLKECDIINLEKDIKKSKPTYVFVAQGSPRQERLIRRLHYVYDATYMGLGGSFDVYTGKVKRAPKWIRENGMEWLYRLIMQPSRIKRQMVIFPFLYYIYTNKY